MSRLFTIDETCKAARINCQTLRNWVTAGMVRPKQAGKTGTGNGHRFSLEQVIGLSAAITYRKAGSSLERALGIFKLIETLGIERLEAHFQAGETWPVPASLLGDIKRPKCWLDGFMIKPPAAQPKIAGLMKQLDLRVIYGKVMSKTQSTQAGDRADETPAPTATHVTPSAGLNDLVAG